MFLLGEFSPKPSLIIYLFIYLLGEFSPKSSLFPKSSKTPTYMILQLFVGFLRDLNPRPPAPKAGIIPLDQGTKHLRHH